MSFTNLYYKRTAGTPRPCYICHKPTPTVLATANTTDFVYACDTHLKDPGFASQVDSSTDGVGAGAAKTSLAPEDIAKVKQEWEERQKRKQDKAKEKEKGKDEKDGADDKGGEGKEKDTTKSVAKTPGSLSPAQASPSPPATPSHEKYTLHRDIFALRLAEHRKRRQVAQAKELAPRLPGTPKTMPPPAPR
ncbi:DUF1742-domain-containing protein [Obba rivulosa]|uniref:DUF1742-domain-containing protein n=1 Tax=Obba rivulosa TaxID=1052685 RepID=A0A8E2DUN5_9APHY|nr:DUF1742-domain-containing protein [Obba rivulosa]